MLPVLRGRGFGKCDVVDRVIENDLIDGSKRILHQYAHISEPACHYSDDDGLIDADQKA
ncbi:hypothetical protein ABZS66_38650 [Dactylosporangium sp. NPDC005572]|uniref:hypothetical protein n=1 Tax=Dactylosporangium sp. NPDC005572 TaxID=3156889 RepID=UPI0033B5D7F4